MIKRLLLFLCVFLCLAGSMYAQATSTVIEFDGTDIYYNNNLGQIQHSRVVPISLGGNNPSGSCFTTEFAYNLSGSIYACINNRWTLASTGGGSTTVFSVQCVGSLATDTAAIKAALTSASTGGIAYVNDPSTCLFDNSAGAFVLTGFSGTLAGGGKGSSIAFSTLANDGIDFNSATNLTIQNISFSFTPATTTRGGGYPINIDTCTNCLVSNNYFNNGNLSGVRIGNSSNVRAVGNTITNFLANGFFTLNNIDLHFENTTCANNGDACEEYSYYDSGTQGSCTRITSTGLTSNNDVSGALINSCSDVSLTNFSIEGAAHECIFLGQDSTTTTLVFPDNVVIGNGNCSDTGYGTNVLNRNTAIGLMISQDGAPATKQHFAFSNITLKHTAGRGLQLGDNNTVDLNTSNLVFVDVGNGNTSATGEGVYLDGNSINMVNTFVENAGTKSLTNHLSNYFTSSNFTSVNPNQLNVATVGILNESNGGYSDFSGIHIIDTFAGASRSTISNTATGSGHFFSEISSICTVSCPSFGGNTEYFAGVAAGNLAVTGVNNTGVGNAVLAAVTTGNKNTMVGAFAGNAFVSGTQNTGVGNSVLNVATGGSNTVIGAGGGSAFTSGNNNTCVGAFCLSGQTGSGPNTCLGENCLSAVITSGANNTALGVNAGNVFTTATKTTSVGDNANSAGTAGLNQSACVGYSCSNNLSNEVVLGTSSEFQNFVGTAGAELTATASLTAGQVVKIDSANASSVVVATTADTAAGIPIGLVNNAPGAAGVAMVAQHGTRNAVVGTGTCSIGNFVIVDTTTNGRVKCTGTYTAGTVIGVALTAQASVGSNVSVLLGLR